MADTMQKPIANSLVVLREEFDDWAVLFNPDTDKIYAVDPVAARIWRLLDGKHAVSDIIRDLEQNCSGVPKDAETHVKSYIDNLAKQGLVGYEPKK